MTNDKIIYHTYAGKTELISLKQFVDLIPKRVIPDRPYHIPMYTNTSPNWDLEPSLNIPTITSKLVNCIPSEFCDIYRDFNIIINTSLNEIYNCVKMDAFEVGRAALYYMREGGTCDPYLVNLGNKRFALIHPEDFTLCVTENVDKYGLAYLKTTPIALIREHNLVADTNKVVPPFSSVSPDTDDDEDIYFLDFLDAIGGDPTPMKPKSLPASRKCECGSESIGYTTHSKWCPKHE